MRMSSSAIDHADGDDDPLLLGLDSDFSGTVTSTPSSTSDLTSTRLLKSGQSRTSILVSCTVTSGTTRSCKTTVPSTLPSSSPIDEPGGSAATIFLRKMSCPQPVCRTISATAVTSTNSVNSASTTRRTHFHI